MSELKVLFDIVEQMSGFTVDEITSKKRSRPLVETRMICSNILKEFCNMTVDSIGKVLNKNHATISYHWKIHKILFNQKNGNYKRKYERVKDEYIKFSVLTGNEAKKNLLEKRERLLKAIKDIDELIDILEKAENQELKLTT